MSLTRSGLHDVSGTLFDVVRGVEGDCLILGDEDGGTRISGPKPWGGGEVIKRFHVDEEYGPIGRLEEENAKLRELARDLWVRLLGTDDNCGCGDCRVCNHDAFNYENPKCIYNERMRTMGIEVEE